MKKTNYFRIQLFERSTNLCDSLVILAAKTNGGARDVSLKQLKTVAEGQILQYPALNEDTTAELIGDNLLHIDTKIGDTYKTVCVIEKVEIMELGKVVEMDNPDDIPGELFTQSNGHGGLAD